MLAPGRGAQRQIELPAADERTVSDAPRGVASDRDRSVGGNELLRGHAESLRGEADERLTRGRTGERKVSVIEVRRVRLRPRRRALIGRHRGVALDQAHPRERDADFLGDQLHLSGVQSLAEFALARIGRDDAVGADRDPRVQHFGGRAVDPLRGYRAELAGKRTEAESDDQRA